MAENNEETLDIYIAYNRLKAADLATYLSNFSFVADKIAEDFFARFKDYQEEAIPTLDVDTIHTGESIKFSLREGWLPKISTNADADIVVEMPKKLGIPVVIGYLFVSTAFSYEDYKNKRLDNAIKEAELQLKRIELAKALEVNNENVDTARAVARYVDNKIPEVKQVLLDTVKAVNRNPDITSFKLNGIDIKDIDRKEPLK